MKYILLILLFVDVSIDPTEIAKINAIKSAAEKAYLAGNFEKSIEKYALLLDSMNIEDESATLNMAHAFRQLNKKEAAIKYYQRLQDAKDESLKSLAYQQLGALTDDPKELENALSYFKESIKSDPSNDDARYNYELLKKKMKEQQQNENNGDDKDGKKQEPSEFAKKLKKQADKLVLRTEYYKAHDLMKQGLEKDPTVAYYNDFIKRLDEVSVIK